MSVDTPQLQTCYPICRLTSTIAPPRKKLRKFSLTFDFMTHCLYYGSEGIVEKDQRHSDKRVAAYKCRSTISAVDKICYKENILNMWKARSDKWVSS